MSYKQRVTICEMCGREISISQARKIFVEGAILTLCPSCVLKISKKHTREVIEQRRKEIRPTTPHPVTGIPPTMRHKVQQTKSRPKTSRSLENFDVVSDYAERIKRAREKLGWTTKILAEKVRERETTIKRIEAGRLKPTINLAKRLEEVLGIKLLEPILPEDIEGFRSSKKSRYIPTLGEIVNIRKSEEE